MRVFKCIMVGCEWCGKSSLLKTKLKGYFSTNPQHPYPDKIQEFLVDGELVKLSVCEPPGRLDEFVNGCKLFALLCKNTDVVLLCFSLFEPSSYEEVLTKWYHLVKEHCPGAPIVLCGMKKDLCKMVLERRDLDYCLPLTTADGQQLANDIGAVKYVECSARNVSGVETVFHEAAAAAVAGSKYDREKATGFMDIFRRKFGNLVPYDP